jgi:hypothetical protein
MLNVVLGTLIFLGGISATLLTCLYLRLFNFVVLLSNNVIEFIGRGFLHCLVMAGALSFAILVLLEFRGKELPPATSVAEGVPSQARRRFITPDFFQNLVAALIAAGYMGLVFMFLNKV